jgi:hypothetical protein
MYAFSYTLAHAGYVTVSWDFNGHSANPNPLSSHIDGSTLINNAESALKIAEDNGYANGGQVAILGHSMGSGVALDFGMTFPETNATIAVSPTSRFVSAQLPRNLLLMAGSYEPRFVSNARRLLADAGGMGGDLTAGTARDLRIIPGVEHVTILFAHPTHINTIEWLDGIFGPQPGAVEYTDWRMLWYYLGSFGAFVILWGISPLVNETKEKIPSDLPPWRRLIAPMIGAIGASIILWLVNLIGLEVQNLLGLTVGGYVLFWLGLAGLLTLSMLRFKFVPPSKRAVIGGLLAFGTLWLGVGLFAHYVWTPWLLIFRRLVLWPFGVLLAFPWFLAIGESLRSEGFRGRFLGWIGYSIVLAAGLLLSLRLIPELFFLLLILPTLPIILLFIELATAKLGGKWPFVISAALYMSWMVLAVFPLS